MTRPPRPSMCSVFLFHNISLLRNEDYNQRRNKFADSPLTINRNRTKGRYTAHNSQDLLIPALNQYSSSLIPTFSFHPSSSACNSRKQSWSIPDTETRICSVAAYNCCKCVRLLSLARTSHGYKSLAVFLTHIRRNSPLHSSFL
jgi:hypothetical protein